MNTIRHQTVFACLLLLCTTVAHAADAPDVGIRHFLSDPPLGRAGRPLSIAVTLSNRGGASQVTERLILSPGIDPLTNPSPLTNIAAGALVTRSWQILAKNPIQGSATYQLVDGDKILAAATLPLNFLPAREGQKLPYIPDPQPVKTQMLVGAHNCPLWEGDKFQMWDQVLYKHPERVPALGFYAQENPEVADWETKWAVEHGISFFTYCWYRDGQGGAIKTRFGSAIHNSLFKSRFAGKMKFTIMWENQNQGTSGVADERDLMDNLLPYWMENYFKNPSYLKVWNEWSEGHYLAPYREYGFGYLDAVRRVFSDAPEAHDDLLPEDIGRGPYDTAFRSHLTRDDQMWALASQVITKGVPEAGLIGYWSFDESDDSPVALDYAGHKLGGELHAKRVPGLDGNALLCDGGSVRIAANPLLSSTALTIECWVKTELAGQDNKWLVNRVYNSGDTGYRLGILGGKPCFEVPQTPWSHHLQADTPLPTGRWVHLAGTFDGQLMRIFVDGQERGTLARPGAIMPTTSPLTLGSYETGHPAHFTGLLDEVKLYDHALDADTLKLHFQRAALSK
jgi:hypothetical protein